MATFNSRYLTCKQISELFIPTQNFYRLTKPCHSVLLGARGSGKTTLLKMLQPEAVNDYSQKGTDLVVPFYGVYIPSDRQWSFLLEQLDTDDDFFQKNVSKALVNLNVLLAFLDTLNYVLKLENTKSSDNYNFAKLLIQILKLSADVPPVLEIIRLHLRSLAIELQNAVQDKNLEYEIPFVCKAPFIESLCQILDMIDISFVDYHIKKQWALCFDEMEIAPEWLKQEIIGLDLRSRDQRILFKITSTPDWNISPNSFRDPSISNDIEVIKCWNSENSNISDWRNFCDHVIEATILTKYQIDRDKLNALITVPNQERRFYLENLPKVDKGFAEYFRRDADLDENNKTVISRASIRSKFYNSLVLAMRYFHYNFQRKNISIENNTYLGDWLLYYMADGNPRSLYNILNEIPLNMEVNGKLKMNIPALGRVIREYSAKAMEERFSYCAMSALNLNKATYSFRDILLEIGNFFKEELLGEEYKPFPRTMFEIDDNPLFGNFVHSGLESGAIVRIEDKSFYAGKYIQGVYRLSYMLYPFFGFVSTPSKEVVNINEIFKVEKDETK